jgi:hypothetical protein
MNRRMVVPCYDLQRCLIFMFLESFIEGRRFDIGVKINLNDVSSSVRNKT